MAKKANGANVNGHGVPEDATREHSVEQRRDAIIRGMQRAYALDCDIDRIIEQEVKPFREDKAAIKADLHEKFGITAQQFNARYGLYKVERRAEEAGDNVTLDVMREMFECLPAGQTLDLVEAAERAAKRRGNGKASDEERPSA